MKTEKIKQHLTNFNFIREMFRVIFFNAFDADFVNSSNISKFLKKLCDEALKIRALIRNVVVQINIYFVCCQTLQILCQMMKNSAADLLQTVRDKKKCLIFCQMFAVLIFFYFIFSLLSIRVEIINVSQTTKKRQQIMNDFNRKKSKLMILIMIYVVTFVDLNFQYDCFRIHVFEIVVDLNILKQAIKRIARLKIFSKIIYLYEYVIKNIFDDKTIMRNINKIISQIMIELNRSIFHDDKNEITKSMKIDD